jgi:protein involved in polysaccharide export with SLBB domain
VEQTVGVDGRISLPNLGILRVQGQTMPEARAAIARGFRRRLDDVQVQVVDYRSQELFVHGEVAGEDRAVPYQGPETVLEVLRRAGGLKPGAALTEVRIVRGHVVEGRSPEVFEIDLRAILLENEPQTNVRVEPFDQIYIGTSRRAEWVSCLPPIFRPPCEWLLGIRREPGPQ